jgi:ribosomal protein S18 acetylase RimI-like enzyme
MFAAWSDAAPSFGLAEGYSLERANQGEWGIYAAIYQNLSLHFEPNWEARLASCTGWAANPFWIQRGACRLGGMNAQPNLLGGLFLIPPFCDSYALLRQVVPTLLCWSDRHKEIKAWPVFPGQVEHFCRLGFTFRRASRSMIRPTEVFDVVWGDGLLVSEPQAGQEEEIAELLCKAQRARGVEWNPSNQARYMRTCIERFAEAEAVRRASTVIREAGTGEIIGVCMISLRWQWPMVFDVAVSSDYQGRGLATRMLQKALTALKEGGYAALTLDVGVGNRAEALYYNLGFLPGVETATLSISPVAEPAGMQA